MRSLRDRIQTLEAATIGLTFGALLTVSPLCLAQSSLAVNVENGVATWSAEKNVDVTRETVKALVKQAELAVAQLSQANSEIPNTRFEQVAPRAVVAHLDRSQKTGQAPSIISLLEQYTKNSGVLLPGLTDFPTLNIAIEPDKPEDFAISINGSVYRQGAKLFRVGLDPMDIKVLVAGKAICAFKLSLKQGEVHTAPCRRP